MQSNLIPEEKYKSTLKLLNKETKEVWEEILKADMLLNAIIKKDDRYIREIIFSPGSSRYINFALYDKFVYDSQANKTYLRNNVQPYPDNTPRTALALASLYGLHEIVELLLAKGADANLVIDNLSPICYVVCSHWVLGTDVEKLRETAKVLLKYGAVANDFLRANDQNRILPTFQEKIPLVNQNAIPLSETTTIVLDDEDSFLQNDKSSRVFSEDSKISPHQNFLLTRKVKVLPLEESFDSPRMAIK